MDIPGASPNSLLPGPNEPIFTVSQLNREVRSLLDDALPMVHVEGEISNFSRPASGHYYFSLKDDAAQVDCAMFRNANRQLQFQPENGMQVLVRAKAGLYEARGRFQLIIEKMEPAGEGQLLRKFEQLKARLDKEGLFASSAKQPLPELPRRIGIVTSPTGAAVRDILHILARRFPSVPVIIYPASVQGEKAQHEIAAAIETAAQRAECDVLIVGRGGGSLEDLWAFNEEKVARAIFACPIPIIAAVGHETDFTIADLVADLRAPTPSGAAELVVPDAGAWLAKLTQLERGIANAMLRISRQQNFVFEQLLGRLQRVHPGVTLRQRAQRVDELTQRASIGLTNRLHVMRLELTNLVSILRAAAPSELCRELSQRAGAGQLNLAAAMRAQIAELQNRLAVNAAELQAVSPLATLERGYAIVQDSRTGDVIRDYRQLQPEQPITGKLASGHFTATVKKTSPG